MAKHRAPSKLSSMAISLPLFFAALGISGLLTFTHLQQGQIPVALPPPNTVQPAPNSTTPPTTTTIPSSNNTPITTTTTPSSSSVSNLSAAPPQKAVQSETQRAPIDTPININPVPINTLPPLPLPSNPPSQPITPLLKVNTVARLNVLPSAAPTKQQPLGLDIGVAVNVPLLIATLGVTVAPTR